VSVPPMSNEADGVSDVARAPAGLAALVVVVVVSYTILFIALAAGGDDAISDNWVGALAGVLVLGGAVASLVALVVAIVARSVQERWALLGLARSVLPILLVPVVLGEVIVMG